MHKLKLTLFSIAFFVVGCGGESSPSLPDKSSGYIFRQNGNSGEKLEKWLEEYHSKGWKLVSHTHDGAEYIFHKD